MSWDCDILLPSPCSVSWSSYSVMGLCHNTVISCPQRLCQDAKSILWTYITQPALRANGLGQKPRGPPLGLTSPPLCWCRLFLWGLLDAQMQECFTIVQIDLMVDATLFVEVGSDSRLFLLSFPSPFSRHNKSELFFVAWWPSTPSHQRILFIFQCLVK